jgi:L-alanine-DL-glutamate epimerase-like enolase superfamily enzyme
VSRAVACAASLAAWDLLGKREGALVADLWGRPAGRDAVDGYFSGFFMELPAEALAAEAQRYREENYRYVKMRPGRTLSDDLVRFREIRSVFTEPGTIAMDAFFSWDVRRARTFLAEAQTSLLWPEDPTPYPVITQLVGTGAPLAGGEPFSRTTEFAGLFADGVRYLLPDLGCLGGPTRSVAAACGADCR